MSHVDDGTDDRGGLTAIERGLADDDPGLAEAFRRWQAPEVAPDVQEGDTAVPPWVLAVFATAAFSWALSPSFGVLAAVVALAWDLLESDQRGPGRPRRRRARERDDGGPPPAAWRNGWM